MKRIIFIFLLFVLTAGINIGQSTYYIQKIDSVASTVDTIRIPSNLNKWGYTIWCDSTIQISFNNWTSSDSIYVASGETFTTKEDVDADIFTKLWIKTTKTIAYYRLWLWGE